MARLMEEKRHVKDTSLFFFFHEILLMIIFAFMMLRGSRLYVKM